MPSVKHTRITLLLVIVACALLPMVGILGREFIAVDRCLDRGGAYDYEAATCDYDVERDLRYVPVAERHRTALLVTGAAAAVGAGCSFLIPIRRRRLGAGA